MDSQLTDLASMIDIYESRGYSVKVLSITSQKLSIHVSDEAEHRYTWNAELSFWVLS